MRTLKEIDAEIQELKNSLNNVEGRATEVYSRIVGYYRSLNNWNLGKKEEYRLRKLFKPVAETDLHIRRTTEEIPADDPLQISHYILFFRETCPNCPAVKFFMAETGIRGDEIDVNSKEGMEGAIRHQIYATPTVVFFDQDDNEAARGVSLADLKTIINSASRVAALTA